jgi:hypothetical protein
MRELRTRRGRAVQCLPPDRRVEPRIGAEFDPARQRHHGKQGMELFSALGISLIVVTGSAWWIFRK